MPYAVVLTEVTSNKQTNKKEVFVAAQFYIKQQRDQNFGVFNNFFLLRQRNLVVKSA